MAASRVEMKIRTTDELDEGLDVLARELGPADFVRFLQLLSPGEGDYTVERYELLKDEAIETIVASIKASRDRKHTDEGTKATADG